MDKVKVVRAFQHADGIYPASYAPGEYEVAPGLTDQPGCMSPRCAEVALAEGWAVPLGATAGAASTTAAESKPMRPAASIETAESGPQSHDSGPDRPSSSQAADPASTTAKSRGSGKRGRPRKSG